MADRKLTRVQMEFDDGTSFCHEGEDAELWDEKVNGAIVLQAVRSGHADPYGFSELHGRQKSCLRYADLEKARDEALERVDEVEGRLFAWRTSTDPDVRDALVGSEGALILGIREAKVGDKYLFTISPEAETLNIPKDAYEKLGRPERIVIGGVWAPKNDKLTELMEQLHGDEESESG